MSEQEIKDRRKYFEEHYMYHSDRHEQPSKYIKPDKFQWTAEYAKNRFAIQAIQQRMSEGAEEGVVE